MTVQQMIKQHWLGLWSLDTLAFMATYFGTFYGLWYLGVRGWWLLLFLPLTFILDLSRKIVGLIIEEWRR